MPNSIRRRAALLALLTPLAACSPGSGTDPASAPASDGAITPDTRNDLCKLLPAGQIDEYKRAHDRFESAPGLRPRFSKGQLFRDGDTLSLDWDQAATQTLTYSIDLLRNCSRVSVTGAPFYLAADDGQRIDTKLSTSAHGSDYPSGTPAILHVELTTVDGATMRGTTRVIGEYTIRLEGPR